ncbi:MAG: hypothetical protein ACRDWN_08270, partial [Acidimicrobiales bacterium]
LGAGDGGLRAGGPAMGGSALFEQLRHSTILRQGCDSPPGPGTPISLAVVVVTAAFAVAGRPSDAPLVAAGGVFYAVFGVFVVAFAVLAVVSVRWAIRRDRAGRAAWVHRQQERHGLVGRGASAPSTGGPLAGPEAGPVAPPRTNGHSPRRPGRKGREHDQPE